MANYQYSNMCSQQGLFFFPPLTRKSGLENALKVTWGRFSAPEMRNLKTGWCSEECLMLKGRFINNPVDRSSDSYRRKYRIPEKKVVTNYFNYNAPMLPDSILNSYID